MELSSFSENIVSVPYERSGQTVNLEINIDAFTPEFFRQVGKKFEERMKDWKAIDAKAVKPLPKRKPKAEKVEPDQFEIAKGFFENEATSLEVKRQIYAELLAGGVLKGWDVTENNLPLSPTVEVLLKLPPLLVEDIWNLALEKAKTVKKRVDAETEGISENSPSGTRGLHAVGQTG